VSEHYRAGDMRDDAVTTVVNALALEEVSSIRAYVDLACVGADGALALVGWIYDPRNLMRGFSMLRPTTGGLFRKAAFAATDIVPGPGGARLTRITRPDVAEAMSAAGSETQFGFALVLPQFPADADLSIALADGRQVLLPFKRLRSTPEITAAFELCKVHSGAPFLASVKSTLGPRHSLVRILSGQAAPETVNISEHVFPSTIDHPATLIAALDRSFALGDAGLLIFGWKLTPRSVIRSVTLLGEDGSVLDVSASFTALVRRDVASAYRARFPRVSDACGFLCVASMPTWAGDRRVLRFDLGDQGGEYLDVPVDTGGDAGAAGPGAIMDILATIPAPERMRHRLYDLFDSGLGRALEAVNAAAPVFAGPVDVRQFGVPVAEPKTSVIVPLYGRYDFVRFQLACFADDADFATVDLVYVVDDPEILSATLELAARYQPLFGLPFRVAWYGENRGFAGANNIGVGLARGENLVLLNSDVIPQQAGWITTLATALDTLPGAGMVGPLLLFGDNSIQHAGMYPRTDTMFPGFLLNTHKGMGTVWEGGELPSEHPMLTAACVVLKTQDFRDLGGFDEGYVIGDFEDSDLCLALRKKGKGMWLVPEAKLWHLERQSQNLSSAVGQRQMVTLFNGWRYKQKILAGRLFNPMGEKFDD